MNFVFDVDGTLTSSREKIDSEFADFFLSFCIKNPVYLVTGSDYSKTLEQLGNNICYAARAIYNCSGNVKYIMGSLVSSHDFQLTQDEVDFLKQELSMSKFSFRTGNHIEKRIGAINFSIVGRNATKTERERYRIWDMNTNERERICYRLNREFTRLEAVVGGETGIDIYVKGRNKSQVRKDIEGPIIFFGDRCEPGGNDYPLAEVSDIAHNVKDWRETETILKTRYIQS